MTSSKTVERQQQEVCERFGAEYCEAPAEMKLGIAENVKSGLQPINGLRLEPTDNASGWFIWAGEDFSDDPAFFVPLHINHVREWCPSILKYLGLPPGWRFLIAENYEDVWQDESILE